MSRNAVTHTGNLAKGIWQCLVIMKHQSLAFISRSNSTWLMVVIHLMGNTIIQLVTSDMGTSK